MLSWTRAAAVALVAPALLVLGLLTAPAHAATSTAPRCWQHAHRCYSAITVNLATGKAYYSMDRPTARLAVRSAYAACHVRTARRYCRKAGWVANGYLAVDYREVHGTGRAWASAIAYRVAGARKRAHDRLPGPGTRYPWAYVGTTRDTRYRTSGGIKSGTW